MPSTSTIPADSSTSKTSLKVRTSSFAEGGRERLRNRCEMSFFNRASPVEVREALRSACEGPQLGATPPCVLQDK